MYTLQNGFQTYPLCIRLYNGVVLLALCSILLCFAMTYRVQTGTIVYLRTVSLPDSMVHFELGTPAESLRNLKLHPPVTTPDLFSKGHFVFDLMQHKPDYAVSGGSVRTAHEGTFPQLNGMGTYLVTLQPKGLRIPHWHPVCNELNYIIQGTARIAIGTPSVAAAGIQEDHREYNISSGMIAFVPQGWLHYIENIGHDTLLVLVVFDSSRPDDIGLSQGLASVRNSVLAKTFDIREASLFESFHKTAPLIMPDGPVVGGDEVNEDDH